MFVLKKVTLGWCLTDMFLERPQVKVNTKRSLKPNPVMTKAERISKMYHFIKDHNKATRYGLQRHFGWGDGIMERLHREFVLMYKDEISWNPKQQEYIFLDSVQEKLL